MTNLKWIAALILFTVAFATGLFSGRAQIQGQWNFHKLEMAENAVKSSEAYRAKEQEWNKQLQEARIESNQWKKEASTAAHQWRVANGKLRSLAANINASLSKSTLEACNRVVTTYANLLSSCDEEQSRMAQAADECVAAYIELDGAWSN